MEKYVVEITKDFKWYERIVVKVFRNAFVKTYNNARISTINALEK